MGRLVGSVFAINRYRWEKSTNQPKSWLVCSISRVAVLHQVYFLAIYGGISYIYIYCQRTYFGYPRLLPMSWGENPWENWHRWVVNLVMTNFSTPARPRRVIDVEAQPSNLWWVSGVFPGLNLISKILMRVILEGGTSWILGCFDEAKEPG